MTTTKLTDEQQQQQSSQVSGATVVEQGHCHRQSLAQMQSDWHNHKNPQGSLRNQRTRFINAHVDKSSSFEREPFVSNYAINNSSDASDEDEDEDSSNALLAVASAEEYAAKITKLQQECLVPLKEDLADWLNKILNTSLMTTDNFMDKLNNGEIVCRLAKIISLWCKQQLTKSSHDNLTTPTVSKMLDKSLAENETELYLSSSRKGLNSKGHVKNAASQSINCLVTSSSATSLNHDTSHKYSNDQFMNNLIRMQQTKIWRNAKCRTFFARDNVCNFIKWSKDFGVNRSVLFESDDLVLHANPRQVVLCLLDVARIAYVKYGFTEAPGLVKFEQEIDKELVYEKNSALRKLPYGSQMLERVSSQANDKPEYSTTKLKVSSHTRNSFDLPVDKTDELVMRYCLHKEKEAARKLSEEHAAKAALTTSDAYTTSNTSASIDSSCNQQSPLTHHDRMSKIETIDQKKMGSNLGKDVDDSSSNIYESPKSIHVNSMSQECSVTTPTIDDTKSFKNLAETGRVDSLDSGEGQTESASTGHSGQSPDTTIIKGAHVNALTAIPVPKKRSNISPPITSRHASSMTQSEISSSRSSLLSNQDGFSSTSKYGRPITSDLDGKVMRIAKSYYGKKATKDVTRLSEGKYKIADRIVFVRLLKGHRVMVRIGGGWDTLENFLFRHKSDPSQIIDPENLLPLETKMPFDKTPQVTPTKASRLPYYRGGTSASTTNLALSNLSVSSLSLMNSASPTIHGSERAISKSVHSTPVVRNNRHATTLLSLQKGLIVSSRQKINSFQDDSKQHLQTVQSPRIPQLSQYSSPQSSVKRPFYYTRKIK